MKSPAKGAGYSETPLWKKLGYKPGTHAWVSNAPTHYRKLLGLPEEIGVTWLPRRTKPLAFVHLFSKRAVELKRTLVSLRGSLADDGVIWVSWPKKSSGVKTDIAEETIRAVALPLGFVDIKVCAVDETWSGLKLMIRKSERGLRVSG